jgi:glutamyl-tRNA reductase
MSILVVGLNYRRVPVDVLERLAFDGESLPKGLHQLRDHEHVREAAILSTCNRVEVYALATGFHAGVAALRTFLSEFHHFPGEDFEEFLYSLYDEEAARQLFTVASGIDSMVVGEPQILSQVRDAFRIAAEEGATGPVLSALFRQAIRVGRRARAETGIARSAGTLAAAGLELARGALGRLSGRTILILGAGKMSDLAASTIAAEGGRVIVANRTPSRAVAVAQRIGGEAVALGELEEALRQSDLVLSSTGSAEPLITHDMVAAAMEHRADRPLVLLDLAVPRDVEPAAGDVDGVQLRNLDDLRTAVSPGAGQADEIERVRDIVAEEVPRFASWQRAHHLAPVIQALQRRGDDIREAELTRVAGRLGRLSQAEREAVDALARAMFAKLLHGPITRIKAGAGTAEGESLVRALRELFGLEEA